MDMSQTEWKRTGEKYSQLNAACMYTYFKEVFLISNGP
jgi:hypothetical protein